MPSHTYGLFARAIRERRQIHCHYDGFQRVLCPTVLGHRKGAERVLAFQVRGQSSKGLNPEGEWKCLDLAKVQDARFGDGPWRSGSSHAQPQSCVDDVDLDVNPASPYLPRRR
jgi:hypothetical protein